MLTSTSGYKINKLRINQNINDNRIVACCQENKQSWKEYNLSDNAVSHDESFVKNSNLMYSEYKSNVNNLSYITETDDINQTVSIDPDGVTLYYSNKDIADVSSSAYTPYTSILSTKYYVEKLMGGVNMFVTDLSINRVGNYTMDFKIDGYDITFYTQPNVNNISRTKPTDKEKQQNIDNIYYSKLNYDNKGPYYLFTYDGRQGVNFSATKTCMNFNLNPDIPSNLTVFSSILGNFVSASYTSHTKKEYLLSFPNSPCNYSSKINDYNVKYLGDCRADTQSELVSQAISYIPLETNSDGIDRGFMGKPTCTGDILGCDKFRLSNSLLLYFVPIEERYQPAENNIMSCRIMTFFGSEFMGWLKYNRSIEVNRDFEVDLNMGSDPAMTPVFVSYTNFNILNVKKQTRVLIGNQAVVVDLYDNVESDNAFYTGNFKDEDIFNVIKSTDTDTYNIEKLRTRDISFVVDAVITDASNITRSIEVNTIFPMVECVLTFSPSSDLTIGNIYLINIEGDNNKINGIYKCVSTNTLEIHEEFNTSDKIKENQLIRTNATSPVFYRLSYNVIGGQISVASLTDPDDINNTPNQIITVDYYSETPSPQTPQPYIVNNIGDIDGNGYFGTQNFDSIPIFKIRPGSVLFPNTYWTYNDQNNIVFQDVTYLYNNLSALTNRTNKLNNTNVVGKVKYRKEYSNATGYGLNKLTLTPMYKRSDLNSDALITQMGNIKQSRLPKNIGTEDDCSLFFSYNPFTRDPIKYLYNLVQDDGTVSLKSVSDSSFSSISFISEHIETNLQYNYNYRIQQYGGQLLEPIVLELTQQPAHNSDKISVIVKYFSTSQLGDGSNNNEILTFADDSMITKSSIRTKYTDSLQGEPKDSYILFEPIKNTTEQVSFGIDVKYGGQTIATFSVTN